MIQTEQPDTTFIEQAVEIAETATDVPEGFTEITARDSLFVLDLRYAGTNNFTKTKLYDCPRCILKSEVAQKLRLAAESLSKKGYRIVLLDCYRPQSAQQKLWDIMPDPHFVMRPWKGSAHTRAIAVDVTLADKAGTYLDMGSEFDEFSPKSYALCTSVSKEAQTNRSNLRTAMKQAGFSGIRTEWWHFQAGLSKNHRLQNFEWKCN